METTIVYWVCIGIMEKKMEATIVFWCYIGNMALCFSGLQLRNLNSVAMMGIIA